MRIQQFLNKVPWPEMEYAGGCIRHRVNGTCPIAVVAGKRSVLWNGRADRLAAAMGLSKPAARDLMAASDYLAWTWTPTDRALNIRRLMIARVERAETRN